MITAIHHVALVSSDLSRSADYYTNVLGLRLIERTADRLYIGTADPVVGCIITIEERPEAEPGREGVGGSHHFALLVETKDGLLQWKRWLTDHGVNIAGPLDRHYFESIYHRDPDGQVIEIATRGAGWTRDEDAVSIGTEHRPPPPGMLKGNEERERIKAETWPDRIPAINDDMMLRQLHHVTAIGDDIEQSHAFVAGALGLRRVKRTSNFDMPDSFHWYWGVGAGAPGTVVTYFERRGAARGTPGPGQIASYALAVPNEAALAHMREKLRAAGFTASDTTTGPFWSSFRTQDPHGQTVEIATAFTGDTTP